MDLVATASKVIDQYQWPTWMLAQFSHCLLRTHELIFPEASPDLE